MFGGRSEIRQVGLMSSAEDRVIHKAVDELVATDRGHFSDRMTSEASDA